MNKKVELLMPAGNLESFYQAINNGADAIYLGMQQFSARANANNFSKKDYLEAIRYAHINNKKIYVTLNTLINDNQINDIILLIKFLYTNDVDAIIIQDLGLLEICSKMFPNLELHISTQMFIHNKLGINFIKKYNVTRIVLARETPIDIIKECCKLDIEIEIFVYGALCTSYSGQCLMSSIIKNRSGNKGDCAGLCRLPYSLYEKNENKTYEENKYLLSLKDLNMLEYVPELINANVSSFKVEGRMKRPEYIGYICSIFRNKIDAYYNNSEYIITDEIKSNLKKLYNRGYTKGYVYNDYNNIYNHYRPNHLGINIGHVINTNKKFITFKLNNNLNQFDGLRIISKYKDYGVVANKIYKNNLLVNKAYKGDIIQLELPYKVDINDSLLLTSDYNQLKQITNNNTNKYKQTINIDCIININKYIKLDININNNKYYIYGDELVQRAINKPLLNIRIKEQLEKIDNDNINLDINIINNDNIFISISQLNKLKRNAIELIELILEKKHYNNIIKEYTYNKLDINYTKYNVVEISNIKQKDIMKANIYVTNNKDIVNDNILYLPDLVDEESNNNNVSIANSIGDINNNIIFSTYNLNITNAYALRFLHENNINLVFLSSELLNDQVLELINNYIRIYKDKPNVGILSYGKRTSMNMKYCPIQAIFNTNRGCNLCKNKDYYIKDNNNLYKIYVNNDCKVQLLESDTYINEFKNELINNYYYRFTTE